MLVKCMMLIIYNISNKRPIEWNTIEMMMQGIMIYSDLHQENDRITEKYGSQ